MHLNSILRQILKVLLLALAAIQVTPVLSQAVPASSGRNLSIAVGAGINYWDVDWSQSRMGGFTLWGNAAPPFLPHILDGLKIEVEGRDIDFHKGDKPPGFREVTASGGLLYEFRRYRNIRPYGKIMFGWGGIDYGACLANCNTTLPYRHDSRIISAPGVGLQYRMYGHLWARADYEYQFWPHLIDNKDLNPQGFTFGAMYNLGGGRR